MERFLKKALLPLEEVRVQQKLSQPTLCELTFFISRDLLAGVSSVSPGRRLTVTVPPRSAPLFDGEITAVEYEYGPAHQQIIRVRGFDLLHRLRKRQHVRVYAQVTPLNQPANWSLILHCR